MIQKKETTETTIMKKTKQERHVQKPITLTDAQALHIQRIDLKNRHIYRDEIKKVGRPLSWKCLYQLRAC